MRDAHRIRDRVEMSFEPRTVVWAALLVAGGLGGAFAGGYRVGEGHAEGATDDADDADVPLDALDNLTKPHKAMAAKIDEGLTFHEVLSPDVPAAKKKTAKTAPGAGTGGGAVAAAAEIAAATAARAGAAAGAGAATAAKAVPGEATAAKTVAGAAPGPGADTAAEPDDDADAPPAEKVSDRDLLASLGPFGAHARGPEYDDDTAPAPVTAEPIVRLHAPVAAAAPLAPPAKLVPSVPPPPSPLTAAILAPAAAPAPKAAPVHVTAPRAPATAAPVAAAPAPAPAPRPAALSPRPAALALAPAAAAPPADARWTVQVGSYPTSEEAKEEMATLAKHGFSPYVVSADVPGRGRWYRVRVGDFAARAAAFALKDELDAFHSAPTLVTTR